MHILAELRRRNVTRAAAAYATLCWLLIQMGDATLSAFGFGDGAQRILIIVLAVGFVPAMALAWVFEITPEGLRRETEIAHDDALRQRTNRVFDRVIIGLLALALGYFAFDKFVLAPQRDAANLEATTERVREQVLHDARGARTIVVLPFINLSSDPEQAYFSDGIAEEVLNLLAKIPELSVTSRSSAFAFKGKDVGIAEIARALDVVYVLEGSVRKSGTRVRITTQLIDARTDTHLWSEVYDRTLEDLFAVQDDVAAKVATQLQLELLGDIPRAQRVTSEAHTEFLKARQLLSSWVTDDIEAAMGHLQQAIALDPDYAAAYAQLADAILRRANYLGDFPAALLAAAPLIEKALALDPELGEAYVTRSQLTEDPVAEEADLRRGLQLNPSYARGYELLADKLSVIPDRSAEAFAAIDRALALDPLAPRNFHIKAAMLFEQNDLTGAQALEKRALVLDPRFRSALVQLGMISAFEGEFADAVVYVERGLDIDPRAVFAREQLILHYLSLGDLDAARELNQIPTEWGRLQILSAEGNWKAAGEYLHGLDQARLERLSDRRMSTTILRHALLTGEYERARTFVAALLSFDGSLPEKPSAWELMPYAALAQLLRASGDEASAQRLLDALLAQLQVHGKRAPERVTMIDVVRAEVLLQRGDTAGALTALERSNSPIPSPLWWIYLKNNPSVVPLQAEPRYQALLANVEAYVARQRALLDVKRRNGEIPERGLKTSR